MRAMVLVMLMATGAQAASITTSLPAFGFCTVTSGAVRSGVMCDYPLPDYPRRPLLRPSLRVQLFMTLNSRGGLVCRVWEVYDPAIEFLRDGRVVAQDIECY